MKFYMKYKSDTTEMNLSKHQTPSIGSFFSVSIQLDFSLKSIYCLSKSRPKIQELLDFFLSNKYKKQFYKTKDRVSQSFLISCIATNCIEFSSDVPIDNNIISLIKISFRRI